MGREKGREERGGKTDLVDDGVVEAAVVGTDCVGDTDERALCYLRALIILNLYGHRPEPAPELGDIFEGSQVIGVENLVVVVGEADELHPQAIVAVHHYPCVVPRVVHLRPELQRHHTHSFHHHHLKNDLIILTAHGLPPTHLSRALLFKEKQWQK